MEASQTFGTEKISKILLKMAPPVMLAQLIQVLYNIVDSLFVGRYDATGLTALSIIYPIQLLMIALAVGTGVGINTVMAAHLGTGKSDQADEYAGIGTPLAVALWFIFALVCWLMMPAYARMSTDSQQIIQQVIVYGRIVCVFSFGLFLESIWTKVLQARGDMKTPMIAQIMGAITNIILDPLLIFGLFGLPEMGIAGAAVATVAGQVVAALIVMNKALRRPPALSKYPACLGAIFRLGMPNILMQSAYTLYIFGLNMILAGFSDQAVTTLGLYYKWQSLFFIPLNAMQTCVVPIISFNYAARNEARCRSTLGMAIAFGMAMMALGTLCFELIPVPMLKVFSSDPLVWEIGEVAFRIIGISFLPLVTSLTFPCFFQALGSCAKSTWLTVIRTVFLFVPLGWLFARIGGLDCFWLTYPVTDTLTSLVGYVFYRQFKADPYGEGKRRHRRAELKDAVIQPSRPGVIITIAREHGSSGKQIGKLVAEKLGIPFYYKEMTALAAQESGLAQEFISDINQNAPRMLHDLYLSTTVVRHAIAAQHKVIQRIAENGSCVIVGRAADHVLRDHGDVVRIFIYAPEEYRIGRVMAVYGDTREEAARNISRSDAARAAYYRNISGREWGDRHNYDLLVDSSMGVRPSADMICSYIELIGKK